MQEQERQKPSLALIKELQERSKQCHEFVRSSFRSERIEHPQLQKALEHYFSYWNDFTHPGLFSIAFEASGGKPDKALRPQAAIAMIAAGFDIHDDIIDKSLKKHDHYTVFGKYGQDLSLLLGNAFMISGLTLLELSVSDLPMQRSQMTIEIIKKRLFEVGNAHALELALKKTTPVSPDKYLQILEMKAASIEADMHIAALIASDRPEVSEALREYGRILGTLATLREEFVDVTDPAELSRRVSSEALPIPIMLAMKKSKTKQAITKKLRKTKLTQKDINGLLDLLSQSELVVELKNKMEKMSSRAQFLADSIGNRKCRLMLKKLARSMMEDL
jgi:geranylgeranyl diphosphate synthase type II